MAGLGFTLQGHGLVWRSGFRVGLRPESLRSWARQPCRVGKALTVTWVALAKTVPEKTGGGYQEGGRVAAPEPYYGGLNNYQYHLGGNYNTL